MTDKKRLKRIYNKKSISALAKHLDVTTATVHSWKRGTYRLGGVTVENPKSKVKFDLIQKGWEKTCDEALNG